MMLENIKILLEHRNLSIEDIFNFLKNNDNFNQLRFIDNLSAELSGKTDYESAVLKTFTNHQIIKNFDNEDLELLKGYFSVMGKTDLQGQISNCRLYTDFFKQKLLRLEAEENSKCKSISTFIVGTGVLIIIVLI